MPPKNNNPNKKQCKAITKFGTRCRSWATLDGYCLAHWYMAKKKYGLKKNK